MALGHTAACEDEDPIVPRASSGRPRRLLQGAFCTVDELAELGFGHRTTIYEAVKRGEISRRYGSAGSHRHSDAVGPYGDGQMIVATARSKRGGRLSCGHVAQPGDVIHKIDTGERGASTSQGQGPGSWVCDQCAAGAGEGTDSGA